MDINNSSHRQCHTGVTPHLGPLRGPAGRVVVPAGAAGSASLTERHESGALEQLGQQLERQRYDHDPRIGPLPLRPPNTTGAERAPLVPCRAKPTGLNEPFAGINPYPDHLFLNTL